MEATASILSSHSHFHTSLSSLSLSKFTLSPKPSSSLIHLPISISTHEFSLKFPLYPSNSIFIKPTFELHSSAEGVTLKEIPEETQEKVKKRKLYVVNLPWSLSSDDLKNLFGQCGTVKDVELIRDKGGKNRGYGFVTMASGDEAQAVIDKFHSTELSGRTIKVEYARRLKKPRPQPQPPTVLPAKETRYKLYVSNLQWKVRSTQLREFFSSSFTPVAARVVFERSPSGRSAGYGFVSFSTREEAEAAIASLDGKELLGRSVRLKFSEQNSEDEATDEGEEKEKLDESTGVHGEKEVSINQPDES
ncbi:RNA-binding protein CP31B chloroplastic [Bienertia sinuspersici]